MGRGGPFGRGRTPGGIGGRERWWWGGGGGLPSDGPVPFRAAVMGGGIRRRRGNRHPFLRRKCRVGGDCGRGRVERVQVIDRGMTRGKKRMPRRVVPFGVFGEQGGHSRGGGGVTVPQRLMIIMMHTTSGKRVCFFLWRVVVACRSIVGRRGTRRRPRRRRMGRGRRKG